MSRTFLAAFSLGLSSAWLAACAPVEDISDTCLGQNPTTGAVASYDRGDPSDPEQAMLEMLNNMRADPGAEAAFYQFDLAEGTNPPLQDGFRAPLAMNAKLLAAARGHSQDMQARNYFDHYDPDGGDPFDRISAEGYSFSAAGENIYLGMSSAAVNMNSQAEEGHRALFVDENYPERGHRVNMVESIFCEVGVGAAEGPFVDSGMTWNGAFFTQNFGSPSAGKVLHLLGVVYVDSNDNGSYNGGEGLGGITVRVANGGEILETQTGQAGGYAITVTSPGDFAIEYRLDDGPICQTATVAEHSVKLDLAL